MAIHLSKPSKKKQKYYACIVFSEKNTYLRKVILKA